MISRLKRHATNMRIITAPKPLHKDLKLFAMKVLNYIISLSKEIKVPTSTLNLITTLICFSGQYSSKEAK